MLHSRPCSGGLAFTVFCDMPSYGYMVAVLILIIAMEFIFMKITI